MNSRHKIVVARKFGAWIVTIVPPIDPGDEPEILPDRDTAMVRARLLWMRYGFKIVKSEHPR